MKEALQHIDLLEINFKKLLATNQNLREENQLLKKELIASNQETELLLAEIDHLKKQMRSLQTANAILGSKENKKATKLKINSLIREIDECIVQLAD